MTREESRCAILLAGSVVAAMHKLEKYHSLIVYRKLNVSDDAAFLMLNPRVSYGSDCQLLISKFNIPVQPGNTWDGGYAHNIVLSKTSSDMNTHIMFSVTSEKEKEISDLKLIVSMIKTNVIGDIAYKISPLNQIPIIVAAKVTEEVVSAPGVEMDLSFMEIDKFHAFMYNNEFMSKVLELEDTSIEMSSRNILENIVQC